MWQPTCGCDPDVFAVDVGKDRSILVCPDGRSANLWGDWTTCIPVELVEKAERSREAYCPYCGEPAKLVVEA